MEQKSINNTKNIFNYLPINTLLKISQFLSTQDLTNIIKAHHYNKCKTNQSHPIANIVSLAMDRIFVTSYLNKTDRSIYMTFYQDQQFKRIQEYHLHHMYISKPNLFQKQEKAFSQIFPLVQKQLKHLDSSLQILDSIKTSIMDPQMPFPKMRKQGIGMFCNSPFQFFLIDLRSQRQQQYLQQCFQDLKSFIEVHAQNLNETQLDKISQDQKLLSIFHKVRYAPDTINTKNYVYYLIEGDSLNNLIVLIFALTSNLVNSYNEYVKSFHDPFALFVELVLRYNIFRNFVLNLQDKMSFLFESYNRTAEQILGKQNNEPTFCFWRPAMTIWYQTMKEYHDIATQVYLFTLTKIRGENLLKVLENQVQQQLPSATISLLNRLQHKTFQLQSFGNLNIQKIDQMGIQGYFKKNPQLYQQILRDYIEYIMDLSVNQLTVHWCGHSSHSLQEPYIQFQQYFLQVNESYYKYLKDMAFAKKQGIQEKFLYQKMLEKQLDFLDKGFVKPITLRKVAQRSNELIQKCKQINIEKNQSLRSTNNSFNISQPSSPLNLGKIEFSTKEQDHKLDYYNKKYLTKSQKARYLPNHQQLNYSQRLLFSITSNTESKILVKSLDVLSKSIQMRVNKSAQNGKFFEAQGKIQQIVQYFSSQVQEIDFNENQQFNVFGKTESISQKYIQDQFLNSEEVNEVMVISIENEQSKKLQTKFKGFNVTLDKRQFLEDDGDEL